MDVWGVDVAARSRPQRVRTAGSPDDLKAMLVFGSNPVVSAPRASGVADRLRALDLLVVADFVMSETAAMADVVFPVTQWAEEDGTMTNLEGRIIRRRKALDPPAGVRSDLEVLHGLAVAARRGLESSPSSRTRCSRSCAERPPAGSSDYSGVTYERLRVRAAALAGAVGGSSRHAKALPRPVRASRRPGAVHPGRPPRPGRAAGRGVPVAGHHRAGAAALPVRCADAADRRADRRPFPRCTWRCTRTRHRGRGSPPASPRTSCPGAARCTAVVRCVPSMRADAVFLPFHFPGDGRANLLTNPALDPTSRMPEFKVCAVRLEPA